MKKILLSFVCAIASISCSQAQKTEFTAEALSSVMIATDKSETTFQQVIDANLGKVVVIDVWASWCPDCIKGFPKYKELQQQFPDVVYLYISMDRKWENWIVGAENNILKGQHFWAPDGMKGVFGQSIDLDWIPRYMVIDQEGKIALYKAIEADDAQIAATIKKLQNNKDKKSKNNER
jgi:thiol-disulfide isomerase/thioredoxin